mmetsp:Transcript_125662/g.268153  ORF Transcript_125662/g.268153 Transcript_125662/m.268153 type:complete len:244 (-) Transcript_125662:49-780(-)
MSCSCCGLDGYSRTGCGCTGGGSHYCMNQRKRTGPFKYEDDVRVKKTTSATEVQYFCEIAGTESIMVYEGEAGTVQLRLGPDAENPYSDAAVVRLQRPGQALYVRMSHTLLCKSSEKISCGTTQKLYYGGPVMNVKKLLYPLSDIVIPPCSKGVVKRMAKDPGMVIVRWSSGVVAGLQGEAPLEYLVQAPADPTPIIMHGKLSDDKGNYKELKEDDVILSSPEPPRKRPLDSLASESKSARLR